MAFLAFAATHAVAKNAATQGVPPGTRLVIDRHVHKTGGTTVRKIFQLNAAQGECMYWGCAPRRILEPRAR